MHNIDFLTEREHQRLETRARIAQELAKGERWQDIARDLNVSTATIAKIYKAMKEGAKWK